MRVTKKGFETSISQKGKKHAKKRKNVTRR